VAVRHIHDNSQLAAGRGDAVVCIRLDGTSEQLDSTVRSVEAHTPGEVAIVVARSGDRVFELTSPADVVLISAGTLVSAGWLDGLRDAAYGESLVATASALTTRDVPEGWTLDRAADAVRSRSLRLRPRLARVAVRCAYVRRSAIELAGGGDDAGFSRRCVDTGLAHVLADDVLVGPTGGGPELEPEAAGHAAALERSLHRARRALTDLSVLVDARILSRPITGTQVHVIELIAALERADGLRVSAIVPDRLDDEAARCLRSLPDVALIGYADADRQPRADVVHRPFQVDNPGELNYLARLGDRLVITHQDLIGYHNPSYFASASAWEGYRELTRTALAVADRVLFFSAHARNDALAEELVSDQRASVVALGIDHALTGAVGSVAPAAAATLQPDAEVILCLGNDYRHKNRVFALRMVDELRRRHGWEGVLILAGPRVSYGSSAADERRLLSERPALAGAVLDLGPVSEPEKQWLLDRSQLVLYPTIHEGFGLVPFEAVGHGVPCMWAPGTSLSELLDDSLASLVAWDAAPSADRALELMRDERARARNVEAIRSAGEGLTWDRTAAALLEGYERTCDEPAAAAGKIYRERGLMSGEVSDDAARLIGPGGALPADLQRPLLALATHPRISPPLFGALKLGYRALHGLRLLRQRFRA
jgi:glycosyltransferase involved in cell wall biosynthesis